MAIDAVWAGTLIAPSNLTIQRRNSLLCTRCISLLTFRPTQEAISKLNLAVFLAQRVDLAGIIERLRHWRQWVAAAPNGGHRRCVAMCGVRFPPG